MFGFYRHLWCWLWLAAYDWKTLNAEWQLSCEAAPASAEGASRPKGNSRPRGG